MTWKIEKSDYRAPDIKKDKICPIRESSESVYILYVQGIYKNQVLVAPLIFSIIVKHQIPIVLQEARND